MMDPGPPLDDPPLRVGDYVRIRVLDRDVDARVSFGSANGRSLVLQFDAMIGGWVGQMPVYQNDDRSWKSIDGLWLTLTRIDAGDVEF